MGKFKDLTGNKINRLTVIKRAPNKGNRIQYYCDCDCGNKNVIIPSNGLLQKTTKSCGCLKSEVTTKRNKQQRQTNKYNLTGEFGIGYTNKGEEFYFDLNEFEKVRKVLWYKHPYGYILGKFNRVTLKLHRFILDVTNPETQVDHENGTKHDCRKSNLRIVVPQENAMNQSKYKNNKSQYAGIIWHKRDLRWSTWINHKNIRYSLGYHKNKEDAIRVREIAELLLFKEYSRRYHELKEKYANEDTSDVEAIIKKKQESIQDNT